MDDGLAIPAIPHGCFGVTGRDNFGSQAGLQDCSTVAGEDKLRYLWIKRRMYGFHISALYNSKFP